MTDDNFYTSGVTYKICANCMVGLINLNLSAEQIQMLIDSGHNLSEFYLHSDFYDGETLEALQPHGG